ncbi:MAG: penicillinase repressor [Frankiales bacterium]|jgi:predicted transcriptional regulator|nr:penicillinase repressor [Frankiales bacterium]
MTRVTRRGDLERAAMEAVWETGPCTARQVAERLADRGLAYTTVLTVLGRLEGKGLLERTRAARAHTYRAVATREDHIALLMQSALGQADDREAALQHFARSVSPAEADALRRALEGR